MRELSRREFYILLAFPALLIIGIYYFAFEGEKNAGVNTPAGRPTLLQLHQSSGELQRQIATLDQSIAMARQTPTPAVSTAREEISLLNNQIEKEKRLAAANAHPGSMLPIRWTSVTGRIQAVHVIESAFETNNMIVVSRETDGEAHKVLSKELDEFAAAVQSDGNHPVPEVWRISVVGSYSEMMAALNEFDRHDVFIIPLSIAMKMLPDDSTRRIWTVWLWV